MNWTHYIRGGMAPSIDAVVLDTLRDRSLSVTDRCQYAAAALTGYADTNSFRLTPPVRQAWYRYFSGTNQTVEVRIS
jgi:hypothetical protein